MSQSIAHLFGSEAKVKIMRLFVFNSGSIFTLRTVCDRVQENSRVARKELLALSKAGLIKHRARGYILDKDYRYLSALEHFLIEAAAVSDKDLLKKLSKAGNMRLVLTSGVFKHDLDARVDLLVVGDKLKAKKLHGIVTSIEAQLGRELRYAAFETPDFTYRMGMYDKLIRDILDYPHKKLVNKVGLQSKI